jgi:hypothetical protein
MPRRVEAKTSRAATWLSRRQGHLAVRVHRPAEQARPVVALHPVGCTVEPVDQVAAAGEGRGTVPADAEIVEPEPERVDDHLRCRAA